MSLNKDQQKAYEAVGKFIKSDERVLAISGGAGTGKSYLINHIYHGYDNIKLTATTNEAAKIIGGITIHKYLGFALGCEQVYEGTLRDNDIILIDECSMLKMCIMRYLIKNTLNKIILVGDANQLTVGLTIDMMQYPFVELKENMRSKSKHLANLVQHLDDCVERQEYPSMKAHQGSHLELIYDHKELLRLLESESDDYILVSYTNKIVDRYVKHGFNAITAHKAQGKSYPIVYIDARDLMSNHTKPKNQFNNPIDQDTYLRLLSVSVSRAMYKVYCFVGEHRKWTN